MSIRVNLFGHISVYGSYDIAVGSDFILPSNSSNHVVPISNLIIGLCTRGRAHVVRENIHMIVQEGDFFVIPPHCQIRFLEKSRNLDIYVLIVSDHFMRRDLYHKTVPIEQMIHFIDTNPVISADESEARYFMDALNLIEKTINYDFGEFQGDMLLHLVATVSAMLNTVIARRFLVKSISVTRSEHIFSEFTKLVINNFREHHELQYYADALCITPKYLSAICTKVCGHPGSRWIAYYLTNEAKNLLKTRRMSISQIADQLGFVNASCFCKFFHKETGVSPSAFRRS